jgi:hypothetical protein
VKGRLASFAVAIVGAACQAAPARQPPRAPPSQPPSAGPATPEPPAVAAAPPFEWRHEFVVEPAAGTFAVVTAGATLRKRPRRDSGGWRHEFRHPRVVKVLARQGEFVEVALDWPDDPAVRHCLEPFGEIGLRVFVLEQELAEVTTASMSLATGEGSGIVVAPGVLVDPPGSGKIKDLAARVGPRLSSGWMFGAHFMVTADVPIPSVGKFYHPARVDSFRARRERAAFELPDDIFVAWRIDYGGREIETRWPIYTQSAADPRHIVTGVDCLQVAGRLRGATPRSGGGGGGSGCDGPPYPWAERWTIAPGTALTWRSGDAAGELHRAIAVTKPLRRRGALRCFLPPFGCGSYEELEVCAPARAVTHVPASEPPEWWKPMIVPVRRRR